MMDQQDRKSGQDALDRISLSLLTSAGEGTEWAEGLLEAFETLESLSELEHWQEMASTSRIASALVAAVSENGELAKQSEAIRSLVAQYVSLCQDVLRTAGKNGLSKLASLQEELARFFKAKGDSSSSPTAATEKAKLDLSLLEEDKELYEDFVAESLEQLQDVEAKLVELEANSEEHELLNAVFRAFHTMKGVSGFLSLKEINVLAHKSEALLDAIRQGNIPLTPEVIDIIFEAMDAMKDMIHEVSITVVKGGDYKPNRDLPKVYRHLEAAQEGDLESLQLAPGNTAEIGSPARAEADSEKTLTGDDVQEAEQVVPEPAVGTESTEAPPEQANSAQAASAQTSQVQAEASGQDAPPPSPAPAPPKETATPEEASKVQVQEATPKPPNGSTVVGAGGPSTVTPRKGQRFISHEIRVDVRKLDTLVDLIGELVIAQSLVYNDPNIVAIESHQLSQNMAQLGRLTSELQKISMSLRMVPIRSTFNKMSRLVRDLSRALQKEINFQVEGEETEIDRNMVEILHDPLVHMIRNAVDHGIEPPEERRNGGKDEHGIIRLRAFHQGGNVVISIEDDGRGLDAEMVLAKAIERGIVQPDEKPSESEIYNLIFEPGFSTAKNVTAVSGRGVGMDVVKKNIDRLRGTIELHSTPGMGSSFFLRLPLTLAIIDGIIVRVGGQRYVMPTTAICESLRPTSKDYHTVEHQGEMISVRGQLLPLIRLHRLFNVSGAEAEPSKALVVVVDHRGDRRAVLVDDLLGKQEVVIKNLGAGISGTRGLSGGAIMGDGKVGLILDMGGIYDLNDSAMY